MSEELKAEIVKSGTWLYGGEVEYEVWIVKQNFQYNYDEDSDESEEFKKLGELFKLVYANKGAVIGEGLEYYSLADAVSGAESVLQQGVTWDDHRIQKLFGGWKYSLSEATEQ